MAETLTVAQHRQAVELGIKQRRDGSWGFKRLCANKDCNERLDDFCFCAPTFAEAVVQVKKRADYLCSRECIIKDQGDALVGNFRTTWQEGGTWVKVSLEDVDRICRIVATGTLEGLTQNQRLAFTEWLSDEMSNWDGDGPDDQCECEIPEEVDA